MGQPTGRDPQELASKRRIAHERLVARLDRRIAALSALSERLSWARLLIFLGGSAASGALFFVRGPAIWIGSILVWLLPFLFVVGAHRRIDAAVRRHRQFREIKRAHLARMALDWAQLPPAAPLPAPPHDHPFARDLNLTGARSLHHLIDTAATYDGSLRLQERLMERRPALEEVQRRQTLVRALRPLHAFRDRLALQAFQARRADEAPWRAQTLLSWVREKPDEPTEPLLRRRVLLLGGLGVANLILLLLAQLLPLPPLWAAGLGFYFVLYLMQGRAASALFSEATALQDALQQMAIVFRYLERDRFARVGPLRALLAPFHQEGKWPSHYLRTLARIVAAAGLSRNPVLWLVLNLFFPWDLFFAWRLQALRGEIGARLPRWLDAWFELECAAALANLGYLNPGYTFAKVGARGEGAAPFAARQMGHPLIAPERKVTNDYKLAALGEVHIITGSNMAGKSSFLRTIGVNLCLASAGGPVDAAALETDLFRLFTAISVSDSVTDGISYFYAEVKRLKALLLALQADDAMPLFFLIDEIFRGTNNRERLLGSRAYIRALVGENGVGLIATHDLELVQLAQEMAQVSNYHFRDSIRDGRMVFDYRLRPGPSPTTNALKVMAAEGLPTPQDWSE